jgi:hypothetical protein
MPQSGMNPLVHYCLYGAAGGRNGVHELQPADGSPHPPPNTPFAARSVSAA